MSQYVLFCGVDQIIGGAANQVAQCRLPDRSLDVLKCKVIQIAAYLEKREMLKGKKGDEGEAIDVALTEKCPYLSCSRLCPRTAEPASSVSRSSWYIALSRCFCGGTPSCRAWELVIAARLKWPETTT